jgi:hypothetical protein
MNDSTYHAVSDGPKTAESTKQEECERQAQETRARNVSMTDRTGEYALNEGATAKVSAHGDMSVGVR